jgi:hypothetical protein
MPVAVSQVWRPSSARSVALDGLLPLPRGVLASDLPTFAWPAKDPGDVLDYEFDASAVLAGDATDQVATVDVTIVPQLSGADLQLGRIVADGAVAVLWLSSGQAGTTYAVQVSIGTLKGRVIGRTVLLPVRAMAALLPVASPLVSEDGTVVTDQNGNPILLGG